MCVVSRKFIVNKKRLTDVLRHHAFVLRHQSQPTNHKMPQLGQAIVFFSGIDESAFPEKQYFLKNGDEG